MELRKKFAVMRQELTDALIEREEEIGLCLAALVAREHVLLVGPPGTAKSLLADSLVEWLAGRKFSILLTKYSVPEEVFGPISLMGLKEDHFRRVTTDKLPEAHIAFIDEIFKASSAILNTMLKILNERTFQNDGVVIRCPLALCVAASNEWPSDDNGGKELGALFDRFLFRRHVKPIATERGMERLLWGSNHTPALSTTITPEEIARAHALAMALPWSGAAQDALGKILKELRKEGVVPGDRRCYKAVGAVRAVAWLDGADEVQPDHLEILAHVLWEDPTEQPRVVAEVVGKIANPIGLKVNGLLMETEEIIRAVCLSDLAQAASATKKLNEIHRKLAKVPGDRAEKATKYVATEIRRIKVATVEAL